MNDEIKLSKSEIIGICEFLKIHHFENSYLLLDYIINLQEENEDLKDRLKVMEHFKNSLLEENEKLEELNVCVGCENNPDYKSRCKNAIEYIKSPEICIDIRKTDGTLDFVSTNELLNILNGGDTNENI